MTVVPTVTCPSPPIATFPWDLTERIVVAWTCALKGSNSSRDLNASCAKGIDRRREKIEKVGQDAEMTSSHGERRSW
jgi:hypothetical protein